LTHPTSATDAFSFTVPADGKTKTIRRRRRLLPTLLALADVLGLTLAFLTSHHLLVDSSAVAPFALHRIALFLLMLSIWLVGGKLAGLYDRDDERLSHSTADDIVRVFLLATVSVFANTHLIEPVVNNPSQRSGVAWAADQTLTASTFFWALAITFVITTRIIARAVVRREKLFCQPTVVVGAGEIGQAIARKLRRHSEYGIQLVGVFDPARNERRADPSDVRLLGGPAFLEAETGSELDSIETIIEKYNVRRVIFAFSRADDKDFLDLVRKFRAFDVHVDIVPRLFEAIGPRCHVDTLDAVPLLGLPPVRLPRSSQIIKRFLDLVGAGIGVVLLAPLFLVIALLIKATSPGPVIFRQTRLGKDLNQFTLLKFRTMRVDTDERVHEEFIEATMRGEHPASDEGLFKLSRRGDVTKVGRWLRQTSLDELPQLINVLRGEMSLVGPRPCIPYEVKTFEKHHFDRFLVPAGLTGLWQTSARAHATYAEALDMDALYAQSWSLGLDLLLIARTPGRLLALRTTQ
jgi:exopolysaccharide biosynthesis polyprenyl glycosylphosphotransferase